MIRPGPLEIGLILVIILIVFGVGKLPQVGAAFGKSIRAFKKGQTGEEEEAEAKAKELAEKKKKRKKAKKKVAKKVTEVEAEEKAEATPEEKA
jgi:sec-independent protein translocase protein TatA